MIVAHSLANQTAHETNIANPLAAPPANDALSTSSRPACNMPAAWFEPDPDAEATCPEAVFAAARRYLDAGLSVIPIANDGSKGPDWQRLPKVWSENEQRHKATWKLFQFRQPRLAELQSWLGNAEPFGLAVVGGTVSGGAQGCGLEIIDFDTAELAGPWLQKVDQQLPGLVEKLVRIQSPRPGLHVYYRCAKFGGSLKLACDLARNENRQVIVDKNGRPKKITLVELKGEGGYCVVPPSPRCCHPRNKIYKLAEGSPDLTAVPVITPEQREVILGAARALNKYVEPAPVKRQTPAKGAQTEGDRPGDRFNELADWAEILEPHGWTFVGTNGDVEYWRRPGKYQGSSATANHADSGLLYVFSSNADPFEEGKGYSKFAAHALLNHEGDYQAAAQDLLEQGYGPQTLPAGKRVIVTEYKSQTMPR